MVAVIRVAIVGGGITGASTAMFLRSLMSNRAGLSISTSSARPNMPYELKVDIFEKTQELGGRLDHVDTPLGFVEMGGSALDSSNLYMKKFVEMATSQYSNNCVRREKLQTGDSVQYQSCSLGPAFWYGGNGESESNPILVAHDLTMEKKGLDQVQYLASRILEAWNQQYCNYDALDCVDLDRKDICSAGQNYKSAMDMAVANGYSQPLYKSFASILDEADLSLVERRLIESFTLKNYTQYPKQMQSLAGFISVQASMGSLVGINIPLRFVVNFLADTAANVVYKNCKVETVIRRENPASSLRSRSRFSVTATGCDESGKFMGEYDVVVLAAPDSSEISVFQEDENDETKEIAVPQYEFQPVYIAVVEAEGVVDKTSFTTPTPLYSRFEIFENSDSILMTKCIQGLIFYFRTTIVCLLKSTREITDQMLQERLTGISNVTRRTWLAYPYMHLFSKNFSETPVHSYFADMTNFVLAPGLYFPNAMEGLFSCAEGQAMAARNVAGLILSDML